MKKRITAAIIICVAALTAILAVFAGLANFTGSRNKITANAYSGSAYSFDISFYNVNYNINTDSRINVTETITINYTGYSSTGFMRDIPIDGEARVKNLTVRELSDGEEVSVAYDVYFYEYDGYDYLTADIGDTTRKTDESHTYVIRYDYIVPVQDTLLSVNPIGTGWDCAISNATVTITAPDGFIADSTVCYIGRYGSTDTTDDYTVTGNTVSVSCEYLSSYNGISFDLYFENGTFSSYFNALPWVMLLIGVVILAALIVLKFFKFTNPPLTPVVNFTAPDDMDPLAVGQLIDGEISSEDVTSLIYYWADKGFLKINMQDENDPVLIRIYKSLPENAPEYQREMYAAIFAGGEAVKVSSLSQRFYPVIERVKKNAAIHKRNMYDKNSLAAAVIFAVLGGLFAAMLPMILAITQISGKMLNIAYLFAVIPSIAVFALTQTVYFFRYRRKKSTSILLLAGIALLGAVMVAVYVWLVPYAVVETAPKAIAGVLSIIIGMLSVTLIVRTNLYNEQMNGIIGFRNFILYTEKDKLEAMLEEDPQLYYHVLPYAQVMGVTDKWEDKFKALTVEPPQWMVDPLGTYVSFVVFNRCMRTSFMVMNRNMAARPPQAGGGHGGHGFGGGGGGFAGGGFGGGGGRGR